MHYNSLPYSSIKWPPRNKQPTCIKFPLPIALFTWKFLHWVEKENIKGQPITKVLRSIDLTYNACSWLSETSRVRFGFWKCWQKVSINFRVLSIPEHLFSNMDIQYNYFMSPLFPNHGCLMHNHCCDYITERKGSATLLSMLYTYRIPVVTLCVVLAHPSTSSCPSMKCTCLGGRTEKVGVPGGTLVPRSFHPRSQVIPPSFPGHSHLDHLQYRKETLFLFKGNLMEHWHSRKKQYRMCLPLYCKRQTLKMGVALEWGYYCAMHTFSLPSGSYLWVHKGRLSWCHLVVGTDVHLHRHSSRSRFAEWRLVMMGGGRRDCVTWGSKVLDIMSQWYNWGTTTSLAFPRP